MATIYKETYTKPLPMTAEVIERNGQQQARWRDRRGRLRTAPVTTGKDGSRRVVIEGGNYIAKYRDASGHIQKISTGCRDETAARAVLGELRRRAELVKAKVITPQEDAVSDHQMVSLEQHFSAFETSLHAKQVSDSYRASTLRYLRRLANECGFGRLGDIQRDSLERWLIPQSEIKANGRAKMSARSRNVHRNALVGFCNWCVENQRLTSNPVNIVPKANERADIRRQRRAMTEVELENLLVVARWRPLAEYGRGRIDPNKPATEPRSSRSRATWQRAPLKFADLDAAVERARRTLNKNPKLVAKLERIGRERALVYKSLVLTGLRRNELASLTVAQLYLDAVMPYAVLAVADEKNREGNSIPLRADLATDLRNWLSECNKPENSPHSTGNQVHVLNLPARQQAGSQTIDQAQSSTRKIFYVPKGLVKILNRDLATAGIDKRDDRGRTIDVHALRHSFGTLLSKGGITPRVAQAAMRHSRIDLTMNVYTDPRLLDVHGALDVLPRLPLDNNPLREASTLKATGTAPSESQLVPMLVPAQYKRSHLSALPDKNEPKSSNVRPTNAVAITGSPDKTKPPLTHLVNGGFRVEAGGHQ